MLQREIRFTGKEPEQRAPVPSASTARVEGETTIDQPDRNIDVLAEVSKNEGTECEDISILGIDSKRSSSEINTGMSRRFWIFGPAVHLKRLVTMSRQGKSGTVVRIAFDCLLEQVERLNDAVLLECIHVRECA